MFPAHHEENIFPPSFAKSYSGMHLCKRNGYGCDNNTTEPTAYFHYGLEIICEIISFSP